MYKWEVDRRAVLKLALWGAAAPLLVATRASASSCTDQIVRVGAIVAPDTLNPFASSGVFWPLCFTYDCLVGVDSQRHPDRKGFASEWALADDGLTWTFKIWKDLKWSDGVPATARDAAFTYNYLKNSIGGTDELNVGFNSTKGLDLVESILAVDGETLRIVTKTPTRWPVDNYIMIVPEHVWKNIPYTEARGTFRNEAPLVGTGPMIIEEFQQGQFARFAPNEHFRTGRPRTSGLVFNFFESADPIAQGIKSGSLDYGVSLTPAQWAELGKDPEITVGESRIEQQNYLAFNTASGSGVGSSKALQDPAFRDALGYAIDQNAIVQKAFRNHADPGIGAIVPAASQYFTGLNDIKRRFDLAEASRRLDAAGYRDSNGDGVREDREGNNFQLQLITGTFSGMLEMPITAVQLVAGWFSEIGIPVTVTQLDAGSLNSKIQSPSQGGGNWDLLVAMSWMSPTPSDMLSLGDENLIGSSNTSYWVNEQFQQLLSKIRSVSDINESKKLVAEAERLFYSEAPYIMLCYPNSLDAHRNDCFQGWGAEDAMSMWSYFPFDRLKAM
ncbi:ABC transporter substrate-binding protein [Sinorhizobium medicae]|uniref:ABC transporter substrate-binding protein n=1 Tax=Sinorhizobium medicae TaxID=110321 RepID=UPI00041542CF|nr:ABC transporter substrate-binding protein [Sinorhizobium medicae]